MKFRIAALALSLTSATTLADDLVLFDGKTLDGWHGDSRFWKVEDGTITGECTEANPCKKTTYLRYTKQEVNNFELTLKYRFLSKQGNSGIQYRSQFSKDKTDFSISGYQADMETGATYSGILYDQSGRRILAKRGEAVTISSKGEKKTTPIASGELAQKSIKNGEWNTYKIIADGNTLTHFINGHKTVEVIDNDPKHADFSGCIALQLHKGPPMKIQFKDINLLELDHKKALASPKWIWAEKAADNQKVTFTNSFNIKGKRFFETPELKFTADNSATLYVNDEKAATVSDWKNPRNIDVTPLLKNGKNTFRVEATNKDGQAGFVMQFGDVMMSDASWQVTVGDSKPRPATVSGTHGDQPWGNILNDAKRDKIAVNTLPNFSSKNLYSVPKSQGSWVSITFDPDGKLYCCDQYGKLYRITLENDEVKKIEPLDTPGKAQGLCFAYGSLYMSVNSGEGGVFRLTDTNKDGKFDKKEHLMFIKGGSEHGSHGIIPSKQGGIYYIAGNFCKLPDTAKSLHNNNWKEDHLLNRLFDARGHASHVRAPGGFVVHMDKDGKNQRVVSTGYRNPYGIAESPSGSLFTYDADMEWDIGTPWYRPTRVVHLTEGSEFGWRTGTSKWPTYFPDSLPAMLDIGPGSPTGTLFGTGSNFPQKYQDALYVLDWTFGRIYAIHLTPEPNGSSYTAKSEVFVSGKPLPVADATIGPDGAIYFVTGGRRLGSKLFKVSYDGPKDNSPSQYKAPALKPLLDSMVANPSIETAWKHLNHADRRIAFTARFTLERFPVEELVPLLKKETNPDKIIQASIAIARLEKHGDTILEKLNSIDFAKLTQTQKLSYLRAAALCYIRTEQAIHSPLSNKLGSTLNANFPADNYDLNVELARLLIKLEHPQALDKTLKLMEEAIVEKQAIDKKLLDGNDRYAKAFREMQKNQPNHKVIQYGLLLMSKQKGWNKSSVTRYFNKLNEEESKKGGNSFKGFIQNIKKEQVKHLTPELKALTATLKPKLDVAPRPIAKGPGRNWTMEEALKETQDLSKASFDKGRDMYTAANCAQCHIHANFGGDSGPNLTNLATRFTKKDILKAIIHPSEEISEQYHFYTIKMKDGTSFDAKIINEDKEKGIMTVARSAFFLAATQEIKLNQIDSRTPSKTSPMPNGAATINTLNPDELRDLMKFLTNEK